MRKKEFYKPRNNIYKKIARLTQSVLYTPKTEKWFIESLPEVKAEKVKEALSFLCCLGYLYVLQDGSYAVDLDFRTIVRGVYHSDGKNGHVHADNIRRINPVIFVPERWNFGAQHNDRVEVVIEGDLWDSFDVICGTVQEIIEPSGDFFVGRQQKIDGKWVVFPENKELGFYIPVEGEPLEFRSGVNVFGILNHAKKIRENAKETADIRQKEKTISWHKICGGESVEHEEKKVYKSCTILKTLKDEEELLLYRYGVFPEMSKDAGKELLQQKKRPGKPPASVDFTHKPAMILSEQCAVSIEKADDEFCIFMHTADLSNLFIPESATEKEFLRRCAGDTFLPLNVKEKAKFKDKSIQNALTVSFKVDKNGNIKEPEIVKSIIFAQNSKNPYYDELVKVLPCDGLSKNPIICAADDAAAIWFDEKEIPAPFIHVRFTEDAENMFLVANKLGWTCDFNTTLKDIHKILRTARKKGQEKQAENLVNGMTYAYAHAFGEDNMTMLFCHPFDNYLSILSQYSFAKYKGMRSSEQKREHLRFMFERAAMYNYRYQQLKYYNCAYSNLTLSKKLKKGERVEGYYISNKNKNEALFFVNGNFGTVYTDLKFKAGEKVVLFYEDMSIDCLEMFYKL